jgi:hypothetical protein
MDKENLEVKIGQIWQLPAQNPCLLLSLNRGSRNHMALDLITNEKWLYGMGLKWEHDRAFLEDSLLNWRYIGYAVICFKCKKLCRQLCLRKDYV